MVHELGPCKRVPLTGKVALPLDKLAGMTCSERGGGLSNEGRLTS